ncbi:MAG: TIGR03905 family TSCPD domain-containing protein [Atopobiaceae bacterium]|nr:TIGR03905 family TSCPD domain-containing protein [Atopobiaceae bacterium]MCH4181435.1 TIGR03905 family TSCPD domain-containing protein [Atopobiaceae bacterium]MCH4214858.1 TIGR03905 family TSCPD domain-containing protein [Atopobiaceae bacterium]MCH4230104.1 TIGR03905 family TSCPD domain-containing protein [Atopobiaceae bacterium]MCH4276980.1 TIGR03905 family TSCPD domain-containing protein [Atopobiaceae bacterium]
MRSLDFKPRGVCSRMIHIQLSDDGSTIEGMSFDGGCNGNLKAVSKLVCGQPVDDVVALLAGNTCGPRRTSCADQMTKGLLEAQRLARGEAAE